MTRPIPTSTYRLHLGDQFTLIDARALVDHIDRLGVDWMYASPVQQVPLGATHGYHVIDPDIVDPQLGGRAALDDLAAELAHRGRGLLLDIVPNHMSTSPDNARWADVLRHGRDAAHARTFDVDMGDAEHPRPIVLPLLGKPVEEVLADGDLRLDLGGEEPRLVVYDDLALPLAPGTDIEAPLTAVLEAQHYRLQQWETGERELNWRRFFAINELVSVRVEDPLVFDDTHRLIADLVASDVVQGLRVDHIDGLADPAGYLQRLRDLAGPDRWLLVEKILETGESLPASWPVDGTTGYEVATLIGAWLVDRQGHARLRSDFEARTEITGPVTQALPRSKHDVLTRLFSAEIDAILARLGHVEGIPDHDVATVLRDMAAHLAGYRTYAPPHGPLSSLDQHRLHEAASAAAVTSGHRVVDSVVAILTAEPARPALLRWQQLTGPASAKGFEDRLLFRHVALLSLCEVGADARLLDAPPTPEEVTAALVRRQEEWPHAGSTSSTHDSKLAEDVRARITVLAEMPDAFTGLLAELDDALATSPIHEHPRWLLAQAALGVLDLESSDPTDLTERLQAYAVKVMREAELDTSHRRPDAAFEAQVADWITALVAPGPASDALRRMADDIAIPGVSNALAALVLKLTGPGVPDVYRGMETWDASLVDPDNRRALRTGHLRGLLDRLDTAVGPALTGLDTAPTTDRAQPVTALREQWRDGLLKLLVTREGLHLRRAHPAVFRDGSLGVPKVAGARADHVAALRRGWPATGGTDRTTVLTVATRLPYGLAGGGWPVGPVWQGTRLQALGGPYLDVLTGLVHQPFDGALDIGQVLGTLPVAMLVGDD